MLKETLTRRAALDALNRRRALDWPIKTGHMDSDIAALRSVSPAIKAIIHRNRMQARDELEARLNAMQSDVLGLNLPFDDTPGAINYVRAR